MKQMKQTFESMRSGRNILTKNLLAANVIHATLLFIIRYWCTTVFSICHLKHIHVPVLFSHAIHMNPRRSSAKFVKVSWLQHGEPPQFTQCSRFAISVSSSRTRSCDESTTSCHSKVSSAVAISCIVYGRSDFLLSQKVAGHLVSSFILSQLDYCNSVFVIAGMPRSLLNHFSAFSVLRRHSFSIVVWTITT